MENTTGENPTTFLTSGRAKKERDEFRHLMANLGDTDLYNRTMQAWAKIAAQGSE
jgi:hypothetical protein